MPTSSVFNTDFGIWGEHTYKYESLHPGDLPSNREDKEMEEDKDARPNMGALKGSG